MFFNKKTLIQNGLNMTQPQYADFENYKKSVQKQFDKVEEEIKEAGIGVTKISQLENDVGFITKDESVKFGGYNIYDYEGEYPNPDNFIDPETGDVDWDAYDAYYIEFEKLNLILQFWRFDESYIDEFWQFVLNMYSEFGTITDVQIRDFFEDWVTMHSEEPLTPEEIEAAVNEILENFPFNAEAIEKLKLYAPDVIDYSTDIHSIWNEFSDIRQSIQKTELTFLDGMVAIILDEICAKHSLRCVNYTSATYWIEHHFGLNHNSDVYRTFTTDSATSFYTDVAQYTNEFVTDPDFAYLFEQTK